MYKVSVPIMNYSLERCGREEILEELKKFNAERVFLALKPYILNSEERAREFNALSQNVKFFKERGFEVGVWFWAFMIEAENDYTKMVSVEQKATSMFICPFDKDFQKYAADYIKEVAKTDPDMIQFDDDFRFSLLAAEPCCLCEYHVAKINQITGENSTAEELSDKILLGPDNKYRQAWIKANGEALIEFSKSMRNAVNEINPKIRIGVCSCTSSWDIDGRCSNEIDHILAGENKPFRRLIMAPYWAVTREWGNKLQNVIELERMEMEWCDEDVELMGEGDAYPRPRTNCPASYLEIFDTALRADGRIDGILKYGLDYYSTAGYEKGYALRHVKNIPVYEQIDKAFGDKTACGVRIIENPDKISGRNFKEKGVMNGLFFTPSAFVLSENSIPTVYSGDGVISMALGENARILTEEDMKKGVIIDASAAKILMEKGIDVGIKSISDENELIGIAEHFNKQNEYVNHMHKLKSYKVELCEGVDVLSYVYEDQECLKNSTPVAYLYENKQGQKFFVYTFDFKVKERRNFCFYARSKQLADGIKALTGKALPAYTYGNPDIYVLAKRNENSMAVGLWNCFADTAYEPLVELDEEYSEISFINCKGRLCGNKVYIEEIAPFEFAGFEVRK